MPDVREQLVVIIGGTSGIGLASARKFAQHGAHVVIAGRDQSQLVRASEAIGGSVRAERMDAADPDQVHALFSRIGPVDHLVLSFSAGALGGPFRFVPLQQVRAGFEGKFWPYLTCLQIALPAMHPAGSVTLVTAGSARSAVAGTSGLAAINGALEALVPPLVAELAPLRINAVSPGIIDTPAWLKMDERRREDPFAQAAASLPAGRIGEADDVAHVVFLAATATYMTGSIIECDGGAHLALGHH
jgi:NAD(P)-dependent dehydrogenase (short-subunit alcohol dehydrogenase family)